MKHFKFMYLLCFATFFVAFGQKKKAVKKNKIKKYSEVITKKAKSNTGLFKTHQIDGKVYFEIPKKQLGKELLWVYQVSKTQTSYEYGGYPLGNRVVRWEKRGNKILLRNVEYVKRATKGSGEAVGISYSTLEAIIMSFDVKTYSKKGDPVVDVTSLYLSDVPEFSPKIPLRLKSMDKKRTFFESVKTFPKNIETRVTATFKVSPRDWNKPRPKRPLPPRSDSSLGSVTIEIHHSMIELPTKKMRPREFDNRVGYFTGRFESYDEKEIQVKDVKYIKRWRLEKKNPEAAISEPKKPIVYYVGRGVPKKWKKYVKEGIEAWQKAFEAAGFKNAIIGKYAPSEEEDPDWDAEDARYSVVRWLPLKTRNAFGPHVADPRTGEILESDIRFYHNHVSTYRNWFFVQSSAHAGKKYQKLPYSDELMGRFVRRVVAHEVGHTIGLRHNYIASHAYSIDQLRSEEWTKKNGISTSMMEYARTNYVAQPGDNADFISKIGPYDDFAIEWGYREFPKSKSMKEDKPYLNKIAERQLKDPYIQFSGGREDGVVGLGDPRSQTEDLSNDAIEATTLGMKNLERVMSYIIDGTTNNGEDYELLNEVYGFLINQIATEANHVAKIVGGVEYNRLYHGQGKDYFKPVSESRQKEAMEFILENIFHVPDWLVPKDLVSRIGVLNAQSRVKRFQNRVLYSFFNSTRTNQMADIEASGYDTYSTTDMLADLKKGIFSELYDEDEVSIYRRNLQKQFVSMLISQYSKKKNSNEFSAQCRFFANQLKGDINSRLNSVSDIKTKAHFYDLSELIKSSMDK